MVAEINWVNESGLEGKAVLYNADAIDHVWYSSKPDMTTGKCKRHEITVFSALLSKLKDCTKVRVKVYDNR